VSISSVITQLRTTDLDEYREFYVSKIGLSLEFRYEDFYAGINAGEQILKEKGVPRKY
jgi:hypothetical protein